MKSSNAVVCRDVSKEFLIFQDPKDRLLSLLTRGRLARGTPFKALKSLSFEVPRGQFLGIIGKNGAGKSTLLRILANVLSPSSGHVEISGTNSLLQLGVGFDPEQTGRENAEFSLKVFGFSGSDLLEKIEEAKTFSEIGDFFEAPVKTYSSGMFSRLAFSVAVAKTPEIMIVDEVLSVGDIRFSQKCLRKMRQFKDSGKTIIFVTHDLQSVSAFCDRVLWIKDGEIRMDGDPATVCESYSNDSLYGGGVKEEPTSNFQAEANGWIRVVPRSDTIDVGDVSLTRVKFSQRESGESGSVRPGESTQISVEFLVQKKDLHFELGLVVSDRRGLVAFHFNTRQAGIEFKGLEPGAYKGNFSFPFPLIAAGPYSVSFGFSSLSEQRELYRVQDLIALDVKALEKYSLQCGYVLIDGVQFSFEPQQIQQIPLENRVPKN